MRLFPESASTLAPQIDAFYAFMAGVAIFFAGLIGVLVVSFAIRYRRANPEPVRTRFGLEVAWICVPLMLVLVMFVWSAALYVDSRRPPDNALEIHVIGKQWMWKIRHPAGQRENNELHVPARIPIRLTMISEDVIHSFYVPAFRVKQDVLPGRYTTLWFEATEPGEYHLFCAEYCGTWHSRMIGRVVVMELGHYQQWLGSTPGADETVSAGRTLFLKLGCSECHRQDGPGRAPSPAGLYGRTVRLRDGRTVTADEDYLRESVLNPGTKIVDGWDDIMPPFQGRLTEDEVLSLIRYLRSLK